jgi:mannosidase alpha-like ER degradation enhancer 2
MWRRTVWILVAVVGTGTGTTELQSLPSRQAEQTPPPLQPQTPPEPHPPPPQSGTWSDQHFLWEQIWDAVQSRMPQSASTTKTKASADTQVGGIPSHTDRRRALYRHSLTEHYATLLGQSQQQNPHTATPDSPSTQTHADTNTTKPDQSQPTPDAHQRRSASLAHLLRTWTARDMGGRPRRRTTPVDRVSSRHAALPIFPPSLREANLDTVREAFTHAYDAYMYHAFPAGELHPLTCTPGSFDLVRLPALTLVDSLDMLLLMDNTTEFARSVERLRQLHTATPLFRVDRNVSVFETNIRVLGGLLSAHQLVTALVDNATVPWHHVWKRDGNDYVVRDGRRDAWSSTDTGTHRDQDQPWAGCATHSSSSPDCVVSTAATSSSSTTTASTFQSQPHNGTKYWRYDGCLLEWALDLGNRLLPAFQTKTGIPYGTVNLLYGVPPGETPVASLAGGGTLSLEFTLLSRLTGDDRFEAVAKRATRGLFALRNRRTDLLGKHVDVQKGVWTETLSGIGSNSDSFLEYLLKHYILFPEDGDFWILFVAAYSGVFRHLRVGEWYVDADMNRAAGGGARHVLESLMAFYPGLQTLLGELVPAAQSLNSMFLVREWLGFLPERFHFGSWRLDGGMSGAGKHPLRPELLESCYLLHKATQQVGSDNNATGTSSGWLWAADWALRKMSAARTECGYASIKELRTSTSGTTDGSSHGVRLSNEMPSFFLSETLKYLYLIFDEDNILHRDKDREWVFTTEAHPIHHVPVPPKKKKGQPNRPFAAEIDGLKEILRARLRNEKTKVETVVHLGGERWSEKLSSKEYQADLTAVVAQAKHVRTSTDDGEFDFFEPRKLTTHAEEASEGVMDAFGNIATNTAHMRLTELGVGDGYLLRKACPNVYSSELLWMHALNGGVLDYSDVHVTQMGTNERPNRWYSLGAIEALEVQGLGIHLDEPSHGTCPIFKDKNPVNATPQDSDGEKNSFIDDELSEFESPMGAFRISSFPEGSGFYMNHVASGETLLTTFLTDDSDISNTFVMTYATLPSTTQQAKPKEGYAHLPTWRRLGLKIPDIEEVEERIPGNRVVVMSDLFGNSFTCTVDVLWKSSDPEKNEDEVLASVPCAPGLFGPAHMSSLADSADVVVEAILLPPWEDDIFGCESPAESGDGNCDNKVASFTFTADVLFPLEPEAGWQPSSLEENFTCKNVNIQAVHRGDCTFLDKAINQKRQWGAGAVIVVNSGEDELFVMSQGTDELSGVDPDDIPLAVLVTGLDGEAILSAAATEYKEEEGYIAGRVSLVRQQNTMSLQSSENSGPRQFPIVNGSPSMLQLLAKGGWGVQATSPDVSDGSDWQLSLLHHKLGDIS